MLPNLWQTNGPQGVRIRNKECPGPELLGDFNCEPARILAQLRAVRAWTIRVDGGAFARASLVGIGRDLFADTETLGRQGVGLTMLKCRFYGKGKLRNLTLPVHGIEENCRRIEASGCQWRAPRSHGQQRATAYLWSEPGALRACRLPIPQRAMTGTGLRAMSQRVSGGD